MSKGHHSVIDLEKYVEKRIRVKFNGGREISGVLMSFDQIPNLVLDESEEYIRDENDPYITNTELPPRKLGLLMARGSSIISITPEDGYFDIDNPF
jgi:U6 snRNA-associated Sm-like protein LSm7